jgi:hypothetical protein
LEGTDWASGPCAELAGFATAACDLVANPSEEDACQEDEEGCKNQPWQGHTNHGTGDGGALEPSWKSTNPHARGVLSAGAKRRDLRVCRAWASKLASPEDRLGRMCATVPSDWTPTKNEAVSMESRAGLLGSRIPSGACGSLRVSSGEVERSVALVGVAANAWCLWGLGMGTGAAMGGEMGGETSTVFTRGGMLRRAFLAEAYWGTYVATDSR